MAFHPTLLSTLVLAFPDNSFHIYDVEARQFPRWSTDLCRNLPQRFTHAHDPILGVAFQPLSVFTASPVPYALFWGSTWICKVKLDNNAGGAENKKRRRDTQVSQPRALDEPVDNFKMVMHYRPLLHVAFLQDGELLAVERPLIDVLATLPPAYFKHKYGAG